jgi:hypothetical protein
MQFEVKKYEFLLEAVTPIAHHCETIGNQSILMRSKQRQPRGGWAYPAEVTGDTMRHVMREAIAYVLLDACGALKEPALTEAALRLLFAGGMITGRGGDAGVIKLDVYREMVDLIPSLGLFGGCANNRCIPGRLEVDEALLVCQETAHKMPQWVLEEAGQLDSCRAHVELVQRVRMDPVLSPEKRNLLTAGEQITVTNRLMVSEAAHDDDDAKLRDATKSSMMPRTFERVASGSLFYWTVTARLYTDLDVDTFNTTVAAMLANCKVGGKRGTGHGLLRAIKANEVMISQPADRLHPLDTTALAPKCGEMFKAHVRERADKVRELLRTVDA